MKKIRSKSNTLVFTAGPVVRGDDIDFLELRRQIRNRVGQDALAMVNATIAAVNEGQYAALKYLFEAIGLFPADSTDTGQQADGLTPALLHALQLPDLPEPEGASTKDSRRH